MNVQMLKFNYFYDYLNIPLPRSGYSNMAVKHKTTRHVPGCHLLFQEISQFLKGGGCYT